MNDLKNGDNRAWWLVLLVLPFVAGIVNAAWNFNDWKWIVR